MAKYSIIDRKAFDFGIGMELYPSEIHMVTAVDMQGGTGVTSLATELGITKGAVSQLVAKLVKKGLLTKKIDPDNKARVIIRTTELGHIASDTHLAFHESHDREFLEYMSTLDDASIEVVRVMGEEMNKWMDKYLK
ncbi:MarR family winged helix-turn-helix transcriptional regulator [Pseudodesulfovibrio sp. JC047]|uniref:MarR family winged helix-turn-helix transcriptional regulator n=1 Tax=Pseudodesulfovibrio sp. JC047 TaxID=2683199 RepID=UPI001EF19D6B|nr:MarR family winged helix-turn-helix transcriptional regulator [Pseudodesulfovibrio sp. JC047]